MATTSCGSRGRIAASGLKNLFATLTLPRVGLVPVTADAATLYETWVGWGGEGIVLKEPTSGYRPGIRSPAWLKVKPKVTLEVIVTGGSSEPIPWGDGGWLSCWTSPYKHPRDGKVIQIRQAVRIRRDEPFTYTKGNKPRWCAGA